MPLEDAMRTQRAIRRLKPDPVHDALILHLIELALRAPTGSNAQNWEFIVVKDPTVESKLGKLNRRAWALYGGVGKWLAERNKDETMRKIIRAVQWQADHFDGHCHVNSGGPQLRRLTTFNHRTHVTTGQSANARSRNIRALAARSRWRPNRNRFRTSP